MDPEFLSVAEVARMHSMTVEGVRARIHAGALPALRVGRSWVIRREDAEAQAPRYTRRTAS